MKVAPVRVFGPGRQTHVDTYACLDSAAGYCLCSQELLSLLGLKGKPRPTAVTSATGTTEVSTANYLSLEIQGYRTNEIFTIDVISLHDMTDLSEHIPSQVDIDRHPHMRGLQIPDHGRKRVDLLICIGESPLQHTFDARTAAVAQLWASCTGLGWVVHGRDSCIGGQNHHSVQVHTMQVRHQESRPPPEGETEILEKVRHIYAIDYAEPQHARQKSMSRTACEMLRRQEETFRVVNGRCEVGKLWRKSPFSLSSNRWHAEKFLKRLARRLLANPGLRLQYRAFIDKLVQNNQAEIAQFLLGEMAGYFLCHHPVLTKFRVVFNGASKVNGECLNDYLDKGPEHTNSLLGSFIRFRTHCYAVSADIKGMFYNVSIPESDRDFMRFLWFEAGDPTKPIVEYRLTHQVPGLTDSPSNACYVLQRLARDNPSGVSSDACKILANNFYVDDLTVSGDDRERLRSNIGEVCRVLKEHGFHLTKFTSNDPFLLSQIPDSDKKQGDLHKILGVNWDTASDQLKIQFERPTQAATRRGILSYVMSPFDPSGITLPYLLDMKLLVQRLFGGNWGWDTPIEGQDLQEWNSWVSELQEMRTITCDRSLIPIPDYREIYLHVFTDASERGYAAVCYVVCDYGNEHTSSFGLGKVRVAPKKKLLTIPRLELLGAVAGVEIAATIREELGVEFTSVHFWTDSTTVLRWATNPDLQLKAFVANRVSKIIEGSEGATWSYVSTKENPADIGSRGLRPSDSEGIRPWISGPSWLTSGKGAWPINDGSSITQPSEMQLEVKKVNAVQVTPMDSQPPLERLFKKYSSLSALVTTAAWLLRMRNALRTKIKIDVSEQISVKESDCALLELIRTVQWTCFPVLMQTLTSSPPSDDADLLALSKKQQRNLKELAPFVDEYGLLRVGGRLQRAGFGYEKTHPLILPKRHDLTRLLVNQYHIKSLHCGVNHVLAQLRKRFWILGGTATVRHYLADCVKCRHARAKLGEQQMAPLPASRFAIGHPPFTYSAVDYFGPVRVRLTRRITDKRWGCLFTCLTTRAVHIEVAHHLSTDSFLMAFRRFISRFPCTREMLSDNGTNFVGAETELKKEFVQNVSLDEIATRLRSKDSVEFRWKFNPPAASHQGGIFERLIGLVKSCLKHSLDDITYRTPDDESLLTMMKEIEGILNSRPLLPAGIEPGSFDVLTPNQILQPGLPSEPQAVREFTAADALKPGYRRTEWHVEMFWRRFSESYIPMLQKRAKWFHPRRNFRENDLVLVKDKDLPRYRWKLAIVTEVHPNKIDGLVRRVTLRQAWGKSLVRDVRSICLLEASAEI